MSSVNSLIDVSVRQIACRPALKLIMQRLQDLSPAIVAIGINQRLFPFPLQCRSLGQGRLRHSILGQTFTAATKVLQWSEDLDGCLRSPLNPWRDYPAIGP